VLPPPPRSTLFPYTTLFRSFPICVVPMLNQDVVNTPVPEWGYFCQISDSTTSFGSYSGAVPNEKITWGKLNVDTPRFVIESDARSEEHTSELQSRSDLVCRL